MVTKKTPKIAGEVVTGEEWKVKHQHQPTGNALKIKLDHLKTFEPLTDNQKTFFEMYKGGTYFKIGRAHV